MANLNVRGDASVENLDNIGPPVVGVSPNAAGLKIQANNLNGNYLAFTDPSGNQTWGYFTVDLNGTLTWSGNVNLSSQLNTTNNIRINNSAPTITFADTDNRSAYIHVNGNLFYILGGPINAQYSQWFQISANNDGFGRWPLVIDLTNNAAYHGGKVAITRSNTDECCSGNNYSLAISEQPALNYYPIIQFHSSGYHEGRIRLAGPNENRYLVMESTQDNQTLGIYATGTSYFPFIYDQQDTNWYVDPNSNTRLVNLYINGASPGSDPGGFGSGSAGGLMSIGGYDMATTGNTPLRVNRTSDNGLLISFRRDGTGEGNISVAGGTAGSRTVSYNPFLGSHWSSLKNREKIDILPGTIMETIDELMEWKVIEFDYFDEYLDDYRKKKIPYNGNLPINSEIEFDYDSKQYNGIIKLEQNEMEDVYNVYSDSLTKHVKVKISDTIGSPGVFGVFLSWDEDVDMERMDENKVEPWTDMSVAAIGNYFIRMAPDQNVKIGDLIESNGNGCGKVQDDDIIRSKTVCKITSTIKQRVYNDGSYLVTCVLYCG